MSKKQILVIDDDDLLLPTVVKILQRAGYHVATAANGEEAIAKAACFDFQLILTDIKMPGLDGIETLKRIKEIHRKEGRPEVPAFFMTGFAEEATEEARALGQILYKPYDIEYLLETVREHLEKVSWNTRALAATSLLLVS
jgi:CheY-like chemotaxis protein